MEYFSEEFKNRVQAEGLDGLGEKFMVISLESGKKYRAKVASVTAAQMTDHVRVDVRSENVIDIFRKNDSPIVHIQVHSATMESLLYESDTNIRVATTENHAQILFSLTLR